MKIHARLFQVASDWQNHVNVHFFASDDPYKKHRALHLSNMNTDFSGRYSCRVSSIHDDEFRSAEMIIYGTQRTCPSSPIIV